MTTVPVAIACLALGVLCYGLGGARLAEGSRHSGGFLTSITWWIGTSLQGAGFGLTLVAREQLPLLIVQASVVGGLAVTAAVQHVTGVRRLSPIDILAIVGLIGGIVTLGTATVAGPSVEVTSVHIGVLLALVLVLSLGVRWTRTAALAGALSGVGFATSAIAARLLVGHPQEAWWDPRQWSGQFWILFVILGAGLAVAQLLLTRGLARGSAAGVLGAMYLVAVLVPGAIGALLLAEHPRPGGAPFTATGLCIALATMVWLLRGEGNAVPHHARVEAQ